MRNLGTCAVVALGLLAGTFGGSVAHAEEPDRIALSVAYFDINDSYDAAEGRLEYRFGNKFWIFQPFVGVMATSDSAFHAFAGIFTDIELGGGFILTPSFAPGYYHEGDGKVLGHAIEFRSQFELSYQFENKSRLGISINHISNAHLDEKNPGTESFAVTYAIPISF